MNEMLCSITGSVQAVAYRVYAQDSAGELGVTGYVRNLPDGSVEVLAQAIPDVLKDFVEYLHEGSLRAKVESVAVDWRTAKTVYDEFSILYD